MNYPELDPIRIAEVVDAVTNGVAPNTASRAAGFQKREFARCEALARQGHPEYSEFVASVYRAEAQFERDLVKDIKTKSDWRGKFKLLESRFNDRWGQKIQVEVKQEVNRILDICERALPEEHYAKVLEMVGAVGGETSSEPVAAVVNRLH